MRSAGRELLAEFCSEFTETSWTGDRAMP
jgi:hypothetical protein